MTHSPSVVLPISARSREFTASVNYDMWQARPSRSCLCTGKACRILHPMLRFRNCLQVRDGNKQKLMGRPILAITLTRATGYQILVNWGRRSESSGSLRSSSPDLHMGIPISSKTAHCQLVAATPSSVLVTGRQATDCKSIKCYRHWISIVPPDVSISLATKGLSVT